MSGAATLTLRERLGRVNRALDWDWRPNPGGPSPDHVVYAVYRRKNVARMTALLTGAAHIHLWALDDVAPELADVTRGSGPGGKFELLNRLLADHPCVGTFRVISDDDIEFTRRSPADLVRYQASFGLGLVQPAHSTDSRHEHQITTVRPRVTARRTQFVEIGPIFSVAPDAPGVLPFPDDAGMGWGLEATWARTPGLTLGIIDAVTIRHIGRVGVAYDMTEAGCGHDRRLAAAGVAHITEIMRTEQTFYRLPRHR